MNTANLILMIFSIFFLFFVFACLFTLTYKDHNKEKIKKYICGFELINGEIHHTVFIENIKANEDVYICHRFYTFPDEVMIKSISSNGREIVYPKETHIESGNVKLVFEKDFNGKVYFALNDNKNGKDFNVKQECQELIRFIDEAIEKAIKKGNK